MHLASGGTAAAPALHRIMDEVMPTRSPHVAPAMEFPLPPHAAQVDCAPSGLDTRTGLRAGPACPERLVVQRPLLALPERYAAWARTQRLTITPTAESPLCPTTERARATLRVHEPRPRSRYLVDPHMPPRLNTERFASTVTPATEEIVWLVDDAPVAEVGYPHVLRWALAPGWYVICARLVQSAQLSAPVTVVSMTELNSPRPRRRRA